MATLGAGSFLLMLAVGACSSTSEGSSQSQPTTTGDVSPLPVEGTDVPTGADSAAIWLDYVPPASVAAGESWMLRAHGECVEAIPADTTPSAPPPTVPASYCATKTVALVRGPGDLQVMSSGPLVNSEFTAPMPAMAAGESIEFHFIVAAGGSPGSYRLPETGEFTVTAK